MQPDLLVEPSQWQGLGQFCVLDTEFGEGSDFLSILAAWSSHKGSCEALHYIAVCGVIPCPPPERLFSHWPQFTSGFHSIHLERERAYVTLIFESAKNSLSQISASCDVILMKSPTGEYTELARISRRGTILKSERLESVTKIALERVGFSLREEGTKTVGLFTAIKTRGMKSGVGNDLREAVVIGAGLAGTAAAVSLSRRGWKVTVLEQLPQIAQGASGNLSAIFSPMISRDDGRAARLSRACFFSLLQELRCLDQSASPAEWDSCGVLQIARDEAEAQRFKEALGAAQYPYAFVQYLEKTAAEMDVGHHLSSGGLLFSKGGWLNPASLCRARIQQAKASVMVGTRVSRLENKAGIWEVFDSADQVLARAPVIVCAQSFDILQLSQGKGLHFKRVRGQVTHLDDASTPRIGRILNGVGYLAPANNGVCSVGATYDFGSDESELSEASHAENLERLLFLLPGLEQESLTPIGGRVGFRCLTSDRFPVVGPLVDLTAPIKRGQTLNELKRCAGLFGLLGLGSRGALWSTLAGEVLAAQICNEPIPVPIDLMNAMDPGRFILKANNQRLESMSG